MPNNSDEVATERYNMLLGVVETHGSVLVRRPSELVTETHYIVEVMCPACGWWDHWDEVKNA